MFNPYSPKGLKWKFLPFALALIVGSAQAQLSITTTGVPFVGDFNTFAGTGFIATPAAGQLDSDDWEVTGWSNGSLVYGGTQTTAATDYTRGTTAPGNAAVTTGGIYSFGGGSIAGRALGFQPGGSDWAPGTITLRLQNNTAMNMTSLDVSYVVHVRDDQARGNSFNFSWSSDNALYNPVGALDLTSNTVGTIGNPFVANNRSTTIPGLNVAPGAFFYLRWNSADVNGSGSRDEFALDDISVTATGSPIANTIVQFTAASSTVSEGVGTTNLVVSINNFSTTQATTVEVAITGGSAARVNNYTTQTVTFPANDGSSQPLTITVTDDAVYDGGGTVTFSLQNVAGGQGTPAISAPSSHVLTITENEPSPLVLNEVDYDMPGANDSLEFVEIYNNGLVAIDLNGFKIELVNGSGGGAAVYTTINLPSFSLAAGAYYVVGNDASIPNINLVTGANTDFIQNGSPDAVGLRDPSNALIDAVSYEGNTGAPYTEGTGILVANSDNATDAIGISRFPNGTDTGDNSADWSRRCISPGATNNSSNINCICAPPEATADVQCIDDFSWEIVVHVTGTGSGSIVNITNNVNGSSALGVGVGDHILGPFANSTTVNVTVAHETFIQCNVSINGLFNNCMPDCNNVIGGPDVPGAPCDDLDPETENDVWDANCICAGEPIVPQVGFTLPVSMWAETDGVAVVGVTMNVAPASTVTVDVTDLLTGTASSTVDYDAVGIQTLTFLPSDIYPSTQVASITILDDPDYEPVETVQLTLAVTSGTANTTTTAHQMNINNDDAALLRINEVDYDNSGTDNAEWLELKNTGASAIELSGFKVELVNGNLGGALVYQTITLPSFSLAAGGYYVIGNNAATPNINLVVLPTTNLIQNGPPDAIGLRDPSNVLLDAISYEGATGAPYTEGTAMAVADADDNTTTLKVIARYLDGNDTDDNSVDWKVWCATPGASNATVDADGDLIADCLDNCPNLSGVQGDACDDNDACTINDVITGACVCVGTFQDMDSDGLCDANDNCPAVPGQIGDGCDDGNPLTFGDVLQNDCSCAGTPIVCDNWTLIFNQGSQANDNTWVIQDAISESVIASGGNYAAASNNVVIVCLPQNACFDLIVTDLSGDGLQGGGWAMLDQNGKDVIDNLNNGDNFTTTATADLPFCSPVGTDKLIASDCDRENFIQNDNVFASANPAVSAEWTIGDQTDDGYQFWFFNPNGGYSRKIFRSHATSGGFGPAEAIRATKLAFSSIVTNPLPAYTLLNIRVRSRVNGVNSAWGPVCRMKIDPEACTPTQLNNNPNSPNYSCGVTGKVVNASGNTGKLFANVVYQGGIPANRYKFELSVPGEGYVRNIVSQNAALLLSLWGTNPLLCGTYTYDVRVAASFNSGASYCPFGPVCTVEITNDQDEPYCTSPGMMQEGGQRALAATAEAELMLWPNPNTDRQLFLQAGGLSEQVTSARLEIISLFGQRVLDRTLAVVDERLNTEVPLSMDLAAGLYFVQITAGDKILTQRLVIE